MPIYEYRCPDCGHQFENMQKFSDPPVTVCPSCGAENVKKLISAPAFHLKGGGWYKDHYGLKSGGGDTSGGSSGASTTASSDSGAGSGASAAGSASSDSGASSASSGSGASSSSSGSASSASSSSGSGGAS
jgi:putative FmdB family regulatory protein